MKKKLIISSIGTSLLTNRAANNDERSLLTRTANHTNYENDAHKSLIEKCEAAAREMLKNGAPDVIRKASAELNGIYGIYGGDLPKHSQDMHLLITTDTVQGKITAYIVKDFLNQKGLAADVVVLNKFSTASKENFSEGIQHLLKWCDETIDGYRESGYEVTFNLTGGFKSQQGFMNTIGMFYADKIVYIFESGSELIEIPRLPIAIDKTIFEQHKSLFLQHYAGKPYRKEDFKGIPETLYDTLNDEVHPSIWGELAWNKVKTEILEKELVEMPFLCYEQSFIEDFKKTRNAKEKAKLQETLAKASVLLQSSNGDIAELRKNGGLQYENYANGIGHFRISDALRVSCIKDENTNCLRLRHYGVHDYVEEIEKIR